MFDVDFYVNIVNSEYFKDLASPIDPTKLPKRNRIVTSIGEILQIFTHYRPARYLIENPQLISSMSRESLDRFEKAFEAANKLL
jgi:hypothetical protein